MLAHLLLEYWSNSIADLGMRNADRGLQSEDSDLQSIFYNPKSEIENYPYSITPDGSEN